MCSGDESALFYVYRVLQKFNAFAGAESIIQAQLKKEYGQPFQHMLNALESRTLPTPPEVSAQDVDTAICFLKQLGRFEPELADYVPGIKGKKTVQVGVQVNAFCSSMLPRVTYFSWEVGPKKDLMVIVQWPEDALLSMVTVLPLVSGQPKRRLLKSQEPIGPNHSK
jgi:hypothetical protein